MKLNSKEFSRKCCHFLEECKLFCLQAPVFEVTECTRLGDGSMMKVTSFLLPESFVELTKCVDYISIHQVNYQSWKQRYRFYLSFLDSLNERQRVHWKNLLIESGFDDFALDKLYYSLLKSN